jgi:hypothetical protein
MSLLMLFRRRIDPLTLSIYRGVNPFDKFIALIAL